MKKVKCSYTGCSDRRPHWQRPEETREHRTIEVEDNHEGKMYCSIECACYAGDFSVRQPKQENREIPEWLKSK